MKKKQKRGEFTTPPRPTGRRSNDGNPTWRFEEMFDYFNWLFISYLFRPFTGQKICIIFTFTLISIKQCLKQYLSIFSEIVCTHSVNIFRWLCCMSVWLHPASLHVQFIVMGDTEYSVIDTSDTTSSGIGIDYWLGIVRYLLPFFCAVLISYHFLLRLFKIPRSVKITSSI